MPDEGYGHVHNWQEFQNPDGTVDRYCLDCAAKIAGPDLGQPQVEES